MEMMVLHLYNSLYVGSSSLSIFFIVDESHLTVFTQNILHHSETYHVDVDVAYDCGNSLGEYEFDESDIEYNSKELEVFSKQEGG